jgi:hypothetical protein
MPQRWTIKANCQRYEIREMPKFDAKGGTRKIEHEIT